MSPKITRRSFSKTLAMTPLMAAALQAGRGAAAADRKFTISLAGGPIGLKANLAESMALAVQHGFESVEPKSGELAAMSPAQLAEVKAALAAKKLQWGVTGVPGDIRAATETDFAASLMDAPKLYGALQAVGATRVKTWVRPAHDELTYLENFRLHADRIRRIAEIAGDYGIRFGLEYVGPKTSWTAARHPFVHTMSETLELLGATGRENVGLVLDSWHWYTAEETEADLLKLTNNQVVSCDLNDAPAGIPVQEQIDQTRALPAATGVIDLKTFLGALVKIGYDGPVQAEPFDKTLREGTQEEAITRTAASMKKAFALID
jgi:sugar phosphate isomerase/epimerase